MSSITFTAIGLAALLFLSGFFSMSETAFTSADRLRLRALVEEGNKRAVRLQKLLDDPESLLTTVLVGNNLVNIAATALATVMAVQLFGNAGAAIATGVMTLLVLVFAEITPKTVAVRLPLRVALFAGGPMRVCKWVLLPLVAIFTNLARGVLMLIGIKSMGPSPLITPAQIQQMVRYGAEEGDMSKFHARVITEVFEFTERDVHLVMTPRVNVQYVDKHDTMSTAMELSRKTGHSRLPVVDGTFDHVLGFVHVKDLLRFRDEELEKEPITNVLRAVLFTHHDDHTDKVFVRMQREHKLMAIIQDQERRNIGIATAEDLLEELVGEIHDEFDKAPVPYGEQRK